MTYWYNVDSGQVEDNDSKSAGDHLMGPYDTEGAAADALATARRKTQDWDSEDKEWNERGSHD